jgi:hypothetical protein
MALPSILELTNGTGNAQPGTGLLDIYSESTSAPTKRLWSIDDANVKIAYVGQATVDALSNKTLTLSAGTVSVAPLVLTSGTNLTTPGAGAVEYDGTVLYGTHAANERGVLDAEQFITVQGGTFTLQSQTAAQKMFGTPTNGQITLAASTSYMFEGEFDLSSMSSSSGSFGIALGGTASLTFGKLWTWANKATLATNITWTSTMQMGTTLASLANTTLVAANLNTVAACVYRGLLRINAGGTIIPQVSLGVAAAAVVGQDSFFRIWPIGSNTVASVGNWS